MTKREHWQSMSFFLRNHGGREHGFAQETTWISPLGIPNRPYNRYSLLQHRKLIFKCRWWTRVEKERCILYSIGNIILNRQWLPLPCRSLKFFSCNSSLLYDKVRNKYYDLIVNQHRTVFNQCSIKQGLQVFGYTVIIEHLGR